MRMRDLPGAVPASALLPPNHVCIGCWLTEEEARAAAKRQTPDEKWAYYLSTKRGVWELIRHPR